MNIGMRSILGPGLLGLTLATVASADTKMIVDRTCPLCETKFKATLSGSGTRFGQRLDLRPVGAITSPWPVAVCTKCRFVLLKNENDKYTAEELGTLRALVNANDYKALPADTPSYERLARLYEGTKRPPVEIGHAYLKASWQVEDQAERNRVLLEKSRTWFEKHLATAPKVDEDRISVEFLRGELLRRIGKFELGFCNPVGGSDKIGKFSPFCTPKGPGEIGAWSIRSCLGSSNSPSWSTTP